MPQVQGPDMLLVIRRGIGQGRRKAFMSAVGMTLVAGFVQVLPGDGPLDLECCARRAPGNEGNVTRPRVADDFVAIRARMEELRRERTQMSAARDARPLCPRPCEVFSRAIRQRVRDGREKASGTTSGSGMAAAAPLSVSADRPGPAPVEGVAWRIK
jgi:hypothetical protein